MSTSHFPDRHIDSLLDVISIHSDTFSMPLDPFVVRVLVPDVFEWRNYSLGFNLQLQPGIKASTTQLCFDFRKNSKTHRREVRNMSCHLNTSDLQHFFVVLDAWIILYVSVGVFSIPTQNLMIALTSTSPIDVIFLLICVSTTDVKTVVIQTIFTIYE